MRVGMNKFDTELAQLNSELKKNNSEGEKVRADFVFFETFNEAVTRKEILALIDAFKQMKEAFDEPPNLSIAMPSPGFFERIFGLEESFEARQKQAKAEHKRYKDELALEIAKLDAQIKAGQALIERHKSLDEHQLRAMIKTYECREEIIQGKVQSVSAKREKLQQAIGPLFENAAQYRQQVRDCEDGLKACQIYSEQLATYHDAPAKRRKVHEACAEQFNGNGRPSDVAYDLNKKLEAARRQLIKIEDRIDDEIKKMDTESVIPVPMLNVEVSIQYRV
jgi:chromosome segregation ATPase